MSKVDSIQVPIFEAESPDYEHDFYAWLMEQSKRLRMLRVPGIDSENLAEEVESLARRDRNAVASRIIVIVVHLLKWKYQPTHRGTSWKLTLLEQRRQLEVLLTDSPSLKQAFPSILQSQYSKAVRQAVLETGLPTPLFPETCEWPAEKLLQSDYLAEDDG